MSDIFSIKKELRTIMSRRNIKIPNARLDELKREEERQPLSFAWAELDHVKDKRLVRYED